jgi:ribosomal-protein-alanine N-acetyltransferase
MTHKGTVTLKTGRLILRRFTIDDVNDVYNNWMSDPDVTRYARQQFHANLDETKAYLNDVIAAYADNKHYFWAITLAGASEPIGRINITAINEPVESVHVSFMIGQRWWSKGYMTEALSAVVRFFFEDVGANRVEGRHDVQNLPSEKVMQKCGFQYEGYLRQGGRNSFGLIDCKQHAILAKDYNALA